MKDFFETEVEEALKILSNGGVILYPTDTIWGIGCDATNERAVQKIFRIKNREDSKSMIVLMADERDVLQYVAAPDLAVFDFLEEQSRPTTVIFPHAVGLASNVIAEDGSVAIRLVKDEFCRHLVKRLRKPIVSTSANVSGEEPPVNFSSIHDSIKKNVDHIVRWRQDDLRENKPSQIIRWVNGRVEFLRK